MTRPLMPWILAALLVGGTLGGGGTAPGVMLLVHLAVLVLVGLELWSRTVVAPIDSTILWPLSGFIATVIAGAGMAVYGYGALAAVLELAVFLGVGWLAYRAGGLILKRLAFALPIAATLQVGYALFRRLGHDEWRSAGTFFNPNDLAAWLVAALLILVGSRNRRPSRRELLLHGSVVLVLFTGLVLSGSRGAWVGLGAGVLYLLLASWPRMKRQERIAIAALLALAAVVVTGAMVQRFRGSDRFSLHRTGIWSGAIAMASDHPWLGVGPNQFDWNARRYQFPDGEGAVQYDHLYSNSHSDWLRVPAECGITGTVLLLLALLGSALVIRRRRKSGELPPSSAGAVAALLALLAQSAFQNLSHSPAVYLTAAALIGGLLGRSDPLQERLRVRCDGRGSDRLSSILGCAVLLVTFIAADVGPYLAYRLTDGLDRAPTRAELQQAVRYNRIQPYIRMSLAETYLTAGPWSLEAYQAARTHGEQALRLHSGDAELVRRLARIEAAGCRQLFRDQSSRRRALMHYGTAERLAPYLAMIPLEVGDFLLTVSDPGGAIAAADRVLALEPGSVPPLLLKASAVLDRDGVAAIPLANSLRQQAGAHVAAAAGDPKENSYAKVMLELDPGREAALVGRIEQLSR